MNVPTYLSAAEMRRLTGLSETTVRKLRREDPSFPRPLRLTPGPTGHLRWIESEIIAWLESRREQEVPR